MVAFAGGSCPQNRRFLFASDKVFAKCKLSHLSGADKKGDFLSGFPITELLSGKKLLFSDNCRIKVLKVTF